MKLNVLADIDWESRVDQTLHSLSDLGYRDFFAEKDYGEGLLGVIVVFMCQDPGLHLKRRIRMVKKERRLYMDIMLDLPTMKAADPALRQRIVAERLLKEVPEVVSRYKIDDFESARFISDIEQWIAGTGWISGG
jgi:hypothetical protein